MYYIRVSYHQQISIRIHMFEHCRVIFKIYCIYDLFLLVIIQISHKSKRKILKS